LKEFATSFTLNVFKWKEHNCDWFSHFQDQCLASSACWH